MLNNNIVVCGDCLQELQKLKDNSVDCVITSPPYNKKGFGNTAQVKNAIWDKHLIDYHTYNDNMSVNEYEEWLCKILKVLYNKIVEHGSIFFNHKPIRHNNKIYHPISLLLKSGLPIYQEIIWNRLTSPNIRNDVLVPCTERIYWITKGKPKVFRKSLEKKYISEVWTILAEKQTFHPAPFPEELVKQCVLLTTQENDIIIDPFAGSGTVGVVCKKYSRQFVGYEVDAYYTELANKRINETQQIKKGEVS